MEDTLQLKHLAPYLPYGLKMKRVSINIAKDVEYTLKSLSKGTNVSFANCVESEHVYYKDELMFWKPLLNPLSRLTGPIEHNGNEVDVLRELGLFKESVSGNSIVDFRTGDKIPYDCLEYGRIEILLQYHFDVFGLIEKGMALEKPIKE